VVAQHVDEAALSYIASPNECEFRGAQLGHLVGAFPRAFKGGLFYFHALRAQYTADFSFGNLTL
jgi:hypothetical protein